MKLAGTLALGLAFGLLSPLASCVLAPRRVEVTDLREFPECAGWLPVSSTGRVAAELVRPGDATRWRAPSTQEQALELLRTASRREALRPVTDSFRFVLSPLLLLPAAHLGAAESASPSPPLLECIVLDDAESPVAGAMVEFVAETVELESFTNEGVREFGEPQVERWSPSVAWIESLAHTSPRCVAVRVEVDWLRTEVFDAEPPQLELQRAFQRETSAEGRAHLHTPDAGYVLAWAPGFEPQLERIPVPRPNALRIRLRSTEDRERVVLAVRRLRDAQSQVARAPYGQGLLERPQLDLRRLADARAELRKLLQSSQAPGWLRGNARVALELALEAEISLCEAATSWWSFPTAPGAEARLEEARKELGALRATTPPSLRLRAAGVGGWADEFADWLGRARAIGLPNDAGVSTPERTELRSQARALAWRARGLDASHPLIELLEALGSPPPLDWPTLVQATRHLETDTCFELLHPELRAP